MYMFDHSKKLFLDADFFVLYMGGVSAPMDRNLQAREGVKTS